MTFISAMVDNLPELGVVALLTGLFGLAVVLIRRLP